MVQLAQPSINPDVVSTLLDNGEAVLMHMGTASYFSLNPTGARIWQLLTAGLPPAAIATQLAEEYAVTSAQAHQSVLALVGQLVEQKLLLVEDAPA